MAEIMNNSVREHIINELKKELIGPDPIPPFIQKNGEEIIVFNTPRLRYGAGILFPQETKEDNILKIDEKEMCNTQTVENLSNEPEIEVKKEEYFSSSEEVEDITDNTINLANENLPSVMGFSCCIEDLSIPLAIEVYAGKYLNGEFDTKCLDKNEKPISYNAFYRQSVNNKTEFCFVKDMKSNEKQIELKIKDNENKEIGLALKIIDRGYNFNGKGRIFSFALINQNKGKKSIENDKCFFQVGFKITTHNNKPIFIPYEKNELFIDDEDKSSMNLLYSKIKSYAIGHGCAASWMEDKTINKAYCIKTEIIPLFEIKPVLPQKFDDLIFNMKDLGNPVKINETGKMLSELCSRYENWITQCEHQSDSLESQNKKTAERHIVNCRECLKRIRSGINLILNDDNVKNAFLLMNTAMLLQQLRYNLPLRKWKIDKNSCLDSGMIPDINDEKTWTKKVGTWRPFQIAFILMNLESINNPDSDERKIVDLIWFPTGGGKTEAYLGLSAFTIFLKRLKNPQNSGTTIIMRYTLRLLTAQQFQRAASLICACEYIRKLEKEKIYKEGEGIDLGPERISIGLWVGSSLTHNKRQDALNDLNEMNNPKNYRLENKFIIIKCPWCGAELGPLQNVVKGYHKHNGKFIFKCEDPQCDFNSNDNPLPVMTIDEDIYETPPSLLLGTVDKFAMIPWKPEIKSIFGFRKNERISPPELIIQDELHLISGPLGSMVGHYETLINELCTERTKDKIIKPKIIASTATISRAKEQCHALYNCRKENVFLFPPQAIHAGESFFAFVDNNGNFEKGRLYAGIHASGLPSMATTQVRVIAAALQSVKTAKASEEEKNYYWTLINYFNNLRELGHTSTLISADIREYLHAIRKRKNIKEPEDTKQPDLRRFIGKRIELTSRISGTKITEYLKELEVNYPGDNNNKPVDICQATNMISVGVDVQRLGLMIVTGQPKTTSEYIQASSRVGRSKNGPGVVIVLYNKSKPRDRSHYEHFMEYHSRIYSMVEPTSVTPFSAPVRERAIHALIVGYLRMFFDRYAESPYPIPKNEDLAKIKNIILQRIKDIDHDEIEPAKKIIDDKIMEWSNYTPTIYDGGFYPPQNPALMYPFGNYPATNEELAWATPTSLRNVDQSCEAFIISQYPV